MGFSILDKRWRYTIDCADVARHCATHFWLLFCTHVQATLRQKLVINASVSRALLASRHRFRSNSSESSGSLPEKSFKAANTDCLTRLAARKGLNVLEMGLCTKVCRKMERKMIADAKVWWIQKQSNMCRSCCFAATCMRPHPHLLKGRGESSWISNFFMCQYQDYVRGVALHFQRCAAFCEFWTRFSARQRRQRQPM